jgi:Skp family chaperone for outer membrane proteins
VHHFRLLATSLLAAAVLAVSPLPAAAQQAGQDWFVPGQQRPPATARPAVRQPPPAPAPAEPAFGGAPEPDAAGAPQQQVQVTLPPGPDIPQIPKGTPPPAAILGVISVPDVLRQSTAYQAVDKELGARRQKLNEDAQKEQITLRDLGQALANDRTKLSPEQIRSRERDLQDRVTESRRKFGERNRIIQEAGQYALAQIERTLSGVVQQVASSRSMNLVLHRAQVAMNMADYDITQQVTDELNQLLPSVIVPPEGVSPATLAASTAKTPGGSPGVTGIAPSGTAPAAAAPGAPAAPPAASPPAASPAAPPATPPAKPAPAKR